MNEITVPSTGRAGQSTQIEQARAMAEVHAMMRIAQDFPRVPSLAVDRMRDACNYMALAERAFYRFPRGGQQVSGPTVHLARELARCWGNIDYGVKELYRNDLALESEMQAHAWDIEVNARNVAGFIVPHKRDVGGKTEPIYGMRDIYENNANAGARRLRECIFAVLPVWFRTEAQALCNATLTRGSDPGKQPKPLHERIALMVQWYATKGIKEQQLADKIGKAEGHWTAGDVATLGVIWQSLEAQETTLELEFPTVFTRAEDITSGPTAPAGAGRRGAVKPASWTQSPAAEVPAMTAHPVHVALATPDQLKILADQFAMAEVPSLAEALSDIRFMIDRPNLPNAEELTAEEARDVINMLAEVTQDPQPGRALDGLLLAIQADREAQADDQT
jgi:hypothetical protein